MTRGWLAGLSVAVPMLGLLCPSAGHARLGVPALGESLRERSLDRVSLGAQHSCVAKRDGSVHCWGSNTFGQLGDGTTTNRLTPVRVVATAVGVIHAIDVAAGGAHTCALLASGIVRCWGLNGFGQLGDGTLTDRLSPVDVSGLSGAVAITAGTLHTCALLADGTVRCWGSNRFGQLGDGSRAPTQLTAVRVDLLLNIVAITAGSNHTCALRADGTARCWGSNSVGQVGNGSTTDRLIPATVVGLANAVAIATGSSSSHTCALLADGSAPRCWGSNDAGQVGNGSITTTGQLTPSPVIGTANAVAITTGGSHTCALLADGSARCWGNNSSGQLGDDSTTSRPTAQAVVGLANAIEIAASFSHTCALLADGAARCWGNNAVGQLGDGSTNPNSLPNAVAGIAGSISGIAVANGNSHTCAIRSNGTAACWGRNHAGQLGNGTTTGQPSAVAVSGLSQAVAVVAGDSHSCALLASGTVQCWGRNNVGQLGNGTLSNQLKPFPVSGLGSAVGLAAGDRTTCALLANGTARCWGANERGQLGDGTIADRNLPVAVVGLSGAVAIAAGNTHTCALLMSGTVQCWGGNNSGQLGDGTSVDRLDLRPVLVLGRAVALAIGHDSEHTCALHPDGTASCWGANGSGQLGDSTTANRARPVPVVGLTNAVAIAAGAAHTCARLDTGRAHCWGANPDGRLGDGSTADSSVPTPVRIIRTVRGVAIPFLLDVVDQVAAGSEHSCAVRTGAVSCWGDNGFGRLGLGDTVNRTTAVDVPSFTLNIDPAVALKNSHHPFASVQVIAICDAGEDLRMEVVLSQGAAWGRGEGEGRCTGALEMYPVEVEARGPLPFRAGPAQVDAEAIIGERAERQEWSRAVTVSEVR